MTTPEQVLTALNNYQIFCTFEQFHKDVFYDVPADYYVEQKYTMMKEGKLFMSLDREHLRRFCEAIMRQR